jgi:hypothetical protein
MLLAASRAVVVVVMAVVAMVELSPAVVGDVWSTFISAALGEARLSRLSQKEIEESCRR